MQLEAGKAAPPAQPTLRPDPGLVTKQEGVFIKQENGVGRRLSTATPTLQSPRATPAASLSLPPIRPPPRMEPTPAPQPRSEDQQVDSQYAKFVARTGEVVWFFRPSSDAWGLGLVTRRWLPKDRAADRAYLIQPLSHPFHAPAQELITTDQHLKPWLAWSAPSCTYEYLQQNTTLRYDQVDWQALLSGQYGNGIPDVDASILSAKAIDTTYTLFERLKSKVTMGVEERLWNGIYFGAEKIWNGDPVRLRMAAGTDILVITEIKEKLFPGAPNQANGPSSKVELVGDVYSYTTLPAANPNSLPKAPFSSNTPLRMREDMRWRNQMLVAATGTLAYWQLMRTGQTMSLQDVKGRWYETSILFVDFFQKAVKAGEGGNGVWMNARGDATGLGTAAGTPRPNRVDAFGNALPKGLQLVEGLDAPDEHAKVPTTAAQPLELGMGACPGEGAFALDDFMNFEGTEDAGMTFPENFTF